MIINKRIIAELPPKYGGRTSKKTIQLDDGQRYMLKFSNRKEHYDESPYSFNDVFAEYIGSKIFKQVGILAQEVELFKYISDDEEEYVTCLCKDFLQPDERLIEGQNLLLAYENYRKGNRITFELIENLTRKTWFVDKNSFLKWYCDVFVVDALIGNMNRHNRNWGLIVSGQIGDVVRISPVYYLSRVLRLIL